MRVAPAGAYWADDFAAADTVPFCLWCAARHLDDFPSALGSVVSVGGDIDTNGAIAGGIVVPSAGRESVPSDRIASRELGAGSRGE